MKWNVVALGIVLMTGPAFAVGPEKSENDEHDNFGELLNESDESKPCRRPTSYYMNGKKNYDFGELLMGCDKPMLLQRSTTFSRNGVKAAAWDSLLGMKRHFLPSIFEAAKESVFK